MRRHSALVLGLGRFGGGVASVRHLDRLGYRIRIADTAGVASLATSVAALAEIDAARGIDWRLGEAGDDPSLLDDIDLLVCNPGVPDQHPLLQLAAQRSLAVTQEVELLLDAYPGTVVVVTGTNGKSTTATLLANALRGAGINTLLGGNIGHSLLEDHADWHTEQVAVLELSSFQLSRLDPRRHQVAGTVLTRITADHLDRHGSLTGYQAAKSRAAAMARDFLVHLADDPVAAGFPHHAATLLRHGAAGTRLAARLQDGTIWSQLAADPGPVLTTSALQLPGRFQAENVMAAFLAAAQLGAGRHASALALVQTHPLVNRLQLAASLAGRKIFGNAISTQIDSTLSAIDSLAGQIHWVGGGKSKDGEYRRPGHDLSERVASAHLFGSAAEPMAAVMQQRVATTVHEHLEAALDAAWAASRSGDTILFSPAFASFDQFANFAARARRFDSWVRRLLGSATS